MYIQGKFREDRIEQLHAFMRAHPLASVVITTAELQAFPMPLELMGNGGNGVLRGHAARKNALSTIPSETKVLVIFQGPNAYISPRWYVSGRDSGQIAPSWNFATVHAVGTLRCIDDVAWVRTHLEALVKSQESTREIPWTLQEPPAEFIDGLVKKLVGIEITIEQLEGKMFLSQHLTPADRCSLANHLRNEPRGTAHDVAALIAAIDSAAK